MGSYWSNLEVKFQNIITAHSVLNLLSLDLYSVFNIVKQLCPSGFIIYKIVFSLVLSTTHVVICVIHNRLVFFNIGFQFHALFVYTGTVVIGC